MSKETARAQQLANDHWGYVAGILKAHGAMDEEIAIIEYHYTTATIHGYKHAIEDERAGFFREVNLDAV